MKAFQAAFTLPEEKGGMINGAQEISTCPLPLQGRVHSY